MHEITTEDESVLLGNYDPKAPRGIIKEAIKKKSANKEDTEEGGSGKTLEAGLNKETAESILGSPEEINDDLEKTCSMSYVSRRCRRGYSVVGRITLGICKALTSFSSVLS